MEEPSGLKLLYQQVQLMADEFSTSTTALLMIEFNIPVYCQKFVQEYTC